MFNSKIEKYMQNKEFIISSYKSIKNTKGANCEKTINTQDTIRETFRFIKEKNQMTGINNKVYIVMGIWLQDYQSNTVNNDEITDTIISGVITKVCEYYAKLTYRNNSGDIINTVVYYSDIVYLFSSVVFDNLQEYINRINMLPPLCENKYDENYEVLTRLERLLYDETIDNRLKLILDGVLAGGINDIIIVENLIIINQLFVIPVTSISGYLESGNCL